MSDEHDEERVPPSPDRVLRRAWSLAAVAWRGMMESTEDRTERERTTQWVRTWVAKVGLADELEPQEADLLALPPGALQVQQAMDATWLSEGTAVLAWALGVYQLPDHQTVCVPSEVFASIGFLLGPRPRMLDPPSLRPHEELDWMCNRLLGLHWRLRDFSLVPRAVDLRLLAGGRIWFGGFDLAGIPLVDDDLAVGGLPIVRADPNLVGMCHSIAMERHRAINWLLGYGRTYSGVDTAT